MAGMTTARHRLVIAGQSGFQHCISRCVRRAWLCGVDALTGRSFEHRRAWVEDRLLELAGIFAVSLYALAVMSNHTHLVLRVDPAAAQAWSDDEVASVSGADTRCASLRAACRSQARAARVARASMPNVSANSCAGIGRPNR